MAYKVVTNYHRQPRPIPQYDQIFEDFMEYTETDISQIQTDADLERMFDKLDKKRKEAGYKSRGVPLKNINKFWNAFLKARNRLYKGGYERQDRLQKRVRSYKDARESGAWVEINNRIIYSSYSRVKTKSGAYRNIEVFRDNKGRFVSKEFVLKNYEQLGKDIKVKINK